MIILSILCATTPDRNEMFEKLRLELMRQVDYMHTTHPTLGHIEIVIDYSKRFLDGGLSIGGKRDALLRRAEGRYVCYLDSDEWIAPNYVETLVRLCHHGRDVCTFRNLTKTDHYWTIVDMSLNFGNDEASPNYITRRAPWHVCPIRTEIAKQFSFENKSYGEDWDWMKQVLTRCTSEAKSDAVIHEYRHSSLISEADKIVRYEATNSI